MLGLNSASRGLAPVIFFAGLCATFLVLSVLEQLDGARVHSEFEAKAEHLYWLLGEHFKDAEVRFGELDKLAALVDLADPVIFDAFARPIVEQSGMLRELEWIPSIPSAKRAELETALGASRGVPMPIREISDAGLVTAGERARYFPVRHVVPLVGNESILGLDMASESHRAAALKQALQSGKAVATTPLRLLQRPQSLSYRVFIPIHRSSTPELLAAVVEPSILFDSTHLGALRSTVRISVSDVTDPAQPVVLIDPGVEFPNADKALVTKRAQFAGRILEMKFAPQRPIEATRGGAWFGVLITGIVLSAMLAALVGILQGRHSAIRRLVGERTAQLEESEARVRQIFMTTPNATLLVGETGRIEEANSVAETLFGLPRAALIGTCVEELIPERFRESHKKKRSSYLHSERYGTVQPMGKRGIFSILRGDGSQIPVSIGLAPLEYTGGRRMIVAISDMSEYQSLTTHLREERDLRQQSLDALNNLLLAIDLKGRVTMINRYGCRLLSRSEDEIIGTNWFASFIPNPDSATQSYDRLIEIVGASAQASYTVRAPIFGGDGQAHTVEWRVTGLRDGGNRLIGTLASGVDISEQLAAQNSATQLGSELKATLNALPDLLVEVDAGGRYVYVHSHTDELLRQPREQILGRRIEEILPPAVARQMQTVVQHALETGRGGAEAVRFDRDDEPRWIEISASRKTTAEGAPTCILLIRDVSNRMLAQHQANQMRAIVQASGELLAYINRNGCVEVSNPAFARIFDCATRDTADEPVADLVGAELFAVFEPELQRAFDGVAVRFPIQIRRHAEGRTVEVELVPLFNDEGIPGVVLSGHDITDRASVQEALEAYRDNLEREVGERTAALEEARVRLASTLESTPVPTFVLDETGRVSHWNKACTMYFGITAEEMIGSDEVWRAFYEKRRPVMAQLAMNPDDQQLLTFYRGICRTSAFVQGAYEAESYFPKLGRWLFFTAAPMHDAAGKCIGAVETLQDVTTRKEAEAMMLRAQHAAEAAARAKSEFLANMSHEIRTPLNGVIGLAQVGVRESFGRQAHNTFARIQQAAVHLLGLINDLLDFSKIESGKFELEDTVFPLYEHIDRALEMTAPAGISKGIRFLIAEAIDLPTEVRGDGLRLTQCLVNLLSNAIKFTEQGHVRFEARIIGGQLSMMVTDTGIGMTQEQMSRLFKPFEQADSSTTRRYGGTGLGLAITHQLVTLMRGKLLVNSSSGTGSRFEMRIPLQTVSGPPDKQNRLGLSLALLGLEAEECEVLAQELLCRGCRSRIVESTHFRLAEGEWLVAPVEVLAEAAAAGLPEERFIAVHDPGQTPSIAHLHWMRPLRVRQLAGTLTSGKEETANALPSGRLNGLRVIGVDDNEINRLVLADLLRLEAAELALAAGGEEALRLIDSSADQPFQLGLLDIEMPGMDGYTLAKKIRERRPDMILIGLTAHASQSDRAKCLAAGMHEHLTKPFDIDKLVGMICELMTNKMKTGKPLEHKPNKVLPNSAGNIGTAPLDIEALLQRFRGRSEFVRRLLGTAEQSYKEATHRLANAAAREDFDELRLVAHSVKGMSGNLVATTVQEFAAQVEQKAARRDSNVFTQAHHLASQLNDLVLYIHELLQKQSISGLHAPESHRSVQPSARGATREGGTVSR